MRGSVRILLSICVLGALGAAASNASGREDPQNSVEQITVDRWQSLLSEVQGMKDVKCESSRGGLLYVCQRTRRTAPLVRETTTWVFAREGHPAYPAVSRGTMRYSRVCEPGKRGLDITVLRSGEYAGDRAAFIALTKQLIAIDDASLSKRKPRIPFPGDPGNP